jgi:hypothetical protein
LVKSNEITITVAGAPTISLSASSTSIPYSGGTITFSGTTNEAAGSTVYWVINGPSGEYNSGSTTVSSSGTFSFSQTFPANSLDVSQTYSAYAQIGTVTSNTVALTQAAAPATITISASSTSLPASGGTVTITGSSNYPGGSAMYLFYNGANTANTTTSSNGSFSFSITVPANSSASSVTDTVYVSDNSAGT